MAVNQRSVSPWARNPRVRIGAVVAVALLIGLVVWLLVRGNGSGTESTTTGSGTGATPTASPVGPPGGRRGDRRSPSTEKGHPIYWAGPKTDTTYELTRT